MKALATLVVLVGLCSICFAATPPYEIAALQDFYAQCCGTSWQADTNWGDGDPCENSWLGITCDLDDHIISISLSSNGVCGELPGSLANITQLVSLSLDGNNIESVDEQVWTLELLYEVSLQNNAISSFPVGIGNAFQLQSLLLGNNAIEGSLPSEVFLVNLRRLDVNNNNLAGSLPDFGHLEALEELYLQHNSFDGTIPLSLGDLPNIKVVDLSYNFFSGELFEFNTDTLVSLNVGDNQFSGFVPSFSQLPALTDLSLSDNFFNGSLPSNFLASSSELNNLDLSENLITGELPATVYQLSKLETLNLAQNLLQGTLQALPSTLQTLDLSYNQFQGSLDSVLPNCRELLSLDLSHNSISGTIPSFFGHFNQLEFCSLAYNQLQGTIPNSLKSMNSLADFSVGDNQIQQNLESVLQTFAGSNSLNRLDLNSNDFSGTVSSIVASLGPFVHFVDISFNSLSGELPNVPLTYEIDISGNSFTCPFPSVWESRFTICSAACCDEIVTTDYSTLAEDHDGWTNTEIAVSVLVVAGALCLISFAGILVFWRARARANMDDPFLNDDDTFVFDEE